MSKTCNNCGSEKKPQSVPYVVLEDFKETAKANSLKWFIVCLVLIVLFVGSNIGWLVYESQFEKVETVEEVVIEAEQVDGTNIVGGGDVIYGTEGHNKEENNN